MANQLEEVSKFKDIIHFDLNMGSTSAPDFISAESIIRVSGVLGGPHVGVASMYARDRIDQFTEHLSPGSQGIDYFLDKRYMADDAFLRVVLCSSRLRELGRLLGEHDNASEQAALHASVGSRLSDYLVPFDASLDGEGLRAYWRLVERLQASSEVDTNGATRSEIRDIARALSMVEIPSLEAAAGGHFDAGTDEPVLVTRADARRPTIEIEMPRYARIDEWVEVTLYFPSPDDFRSTADRGFMEGETVAVVTGPSFVLRNSIRGTGWPRGNRRVQMKFAVKPKRLGMRGLRFEFFCGAERVAEVFSKTLVTTPALYP